MCEDLLKVILSRCSIRLFKQDSIPDQLILKILECGVRAPNAGGSEPWYFIVVKDESLRREIHKLLLEAHRLYATSVLREPLPPEKVSKWVQRIVGGMYLAPVYIAVYADFRRSTHNVQYSEVEKVYIIQSVSAAIENIILAAHALGLGSVWLGVPLLMKDRFDELLKPPEGCELQAIIALGYPSEQPRVRPRRSIDEVVKII
jgi:nitroreductase